MTYPKKLSDNTWAIQVKENNKTKELIVHFPQGAIDQAGWDNGESSLKDTLLSSETVEINLIIRKVD